MGSLLNIYETLEEVLGKEKAKRFTEALDNLTKEKQSELKSLLKDELLNELATKQDIELLRKELELNKKELEKKIEETKSEILKWFIGLFISLVVFLIGWSFTLLKLFEKHP